MHVLTSRNFRKRTIYHLRVCSHSGSENPSASSSPVSPARPCCSLASFSSMSWTRAGTRPLLAARDPRLQYYDITCEYCC